MSKSKNSKKNTNMLAMANIMKRMQMRPKPKAKKRKAPKGVSMGPVSSINTAPVAIGNSVRGAKSVSTKTSDGIIVNGRDFMFTPIGSGSITTWTLVGGVPLATAAFADSTIRQYMQMYQKYRWRRCVVHYITSSPTSANGDVMFYHGKNRDSVFLNQTSSFLLPFVISDPDTVLGPQWTNHSADLKVEGTWKSTDYGMSDVPNDYADGEVFLLSKTSTTDSPGYVLFDYVIEFAEMQISPRLLSLPLPRAQYSQFGLGGAGITLTVNGYAALALYGNGISGSASSNPPGLVDGDIYKVIIDKTNSSTLPSGLATLKTATNGGTIQTASIPLQDGTTCYAVVGSNGFNLFPNPTAAYAASDNLLFTATNATVTFTLQVWMSLIGTTSSINLNPNF